MCTFIYINHLIILLDTHHTYLVHYHLYIHLYFNHVRTFINATSIYNIFL